MTNDEKEKQFNLGLIKKKKKSLLHHANVGYMGLCKFNFVILLLLPVLAQWRFSSLSVRPIVKVI